MGTNVLLKVRGAKGRPVWRYKDNTANIFDGLILSDLKEKELKQILFEMDVEEKESAEISTELFTYHLSYNRVDDNLPEGPITGNLEIPTEKFSENWLQHRKFNDEPLVFLTIQECNDLDKQVLQLISVKKFAEAITIKQRVVDTLSKLVDRDSLGFIRVLVMKGKQRIKELEQLQVNNNSSSLSRVCKAMHEEAAWESDTDMGFGLFD
jgi:hypothetical protein